MEVVIIAQNSKLQELSKMVRHLVAQLLARPLNPALNNPEDKPIRPQIENSQQELDDLDFRFKFNKLTHLYFCFDPYDISSNMLIF